VEQELTPASEMGVIEEVEGDPELRYCLAVTSGMAEVEILAYVGFPARVSVIGPSGDVVLSFEPSPTETSLSGVLEQGLYTVLLEPLEPGATGAYQLSATVF
jgi:hypothetical protein